MGSESVNPRRETRGRDSGKKKKEEGCPGFGDNLKKESKLPGGRKHLIWGLVASKCAVSGDKRWEESSGDESLGSL